MFALVISPLSSGEAQRARSGGAGRQNRQEMEQRVQVRLANLLRTQLGLNDEEMRQLSDVNQRFDRQRRDLNRREMMTRMTLRQEVLKQDSADSGRVVQLIKDQLRFERERIDLTEAEQLELGKFLTPVQRARYLGVQEQMRREMDQLRRRGMQPMGDPTVGGGQRVRRPPT